MWTGCVLVVTRTAHVTRTANQATALSAPTSHTLGVGPVRLNKVICAAVNPNPNPNYLGTVSPWVLRCFLDQSIYQSIQDCSLNIPPPKPFGVQIFHLPYMAVHQITFYQIFQLAIYSPTI